MKCRVVVFFVGFFFSFLFLPQRTEQHDVGGGDARKDPKGEDA